MFVISKEEKLLFELYKAIGTPEEIHKRMASPYPEANEGYAPLPEVLREDFHVCAGVLEDDGLGMAPLPIWNGRQEERICSMGCIPIDDPACTIVQDDWEEK